MPQHLEYVVLWMRPGKARSPLNVEGSLAAWHPAQRTQSLTVGSEDEILRKVHPARKLSRNSLRRRRRLQLLFGVRAGPSSYWQNRVTGARGGQGEDRPVRLHSADERRQGQHLHSVLHCQRVGFTAACSQLQLWVST